MKKVLLLLEEIRYGKPVEQKCLEVFKALAGRYEIHVYAKEVSLNEVGEYLRMKGASFHTPDPFQNFSKEFDVLVALDDWGMANSSIFNALKKVRIKDTTTTAELARFIEFVDVKKNLTDEKSPSSSLADQENQQTPPSTVSSSKPSRASKSSKSSTKTAKGRAGQGTKDSKK